MLGALFIYLFILFSLIIIFFPGLLEEFETLQVTTSVLDLPECFLAAHLPLS